jgi:cob(I)alamin adenosyltransferase
MAKFQRITRVTTKTGDRGTTVRIGGACVPKDHPAIQVLGDLDELNSALGVARAAGLPKTLDARVTEIQIDLFVVGSDVLAPPDIEAPRVNQEMVARLEKWTDEYRRTLPPLQEFVLPGGTEAGARLHLARAICRRAERSLAAFLKTEAHSDWLMPYVNRLSDTLFVMARHVNRVSGGAEESARFSEREKRAKMRERRARPPSG